MFRTLSLTFVAAATSLVSAQPSSTPSTAQPKPAETTPASPDLSARLGEFFESTEPTELASGLGFTEGPLYRTGELLFCDIAARRIYTLALGKAEAKPAIFHDHASRPAGLAADHSGKLICAHFDGFLTKQDGAGAFSTFLEKVEDKKLNSPNDVIVRSDGSVLFTDPSFGLGKDRPGEIGYNAVYMLAVDSDGKAGKTTLITKDLRLPNGLALTQNEKTLIVADHGTGELFAFDMTASDIPASKKLFAKLSGRGADGIKFDEAGNLYVAGAGGIWVFSPTGETLCKLPVRGCSNLCFGGEDRKTLFITAGTRVFSVKAKHAGLALPRPASK